MSTVIGITLKIIGYVTLAAMSFSLFVCVTLAIAMARADRANQNKKP